MTPETRESTRAELGLSPLPLRFALPPRLARRLRIRATQENRTPEATAARLLASALVPDRFERRRMVKADLRDAGVQP